MRGATVLRTCENHSEPTLVKWLAAAHDSPAFGYHATALHVRLSPGSLTLTSAQSSESADGGWLCWSWNIQAADETMAFGLVKGSVPSKGPDNVAWHLNDVGCSTTSEPEFRGWVLGFRS